MRRFSTTVLAGTALLASSIGYVIAQQQQSAPARPSGIRGTEIAKIDLGERFPGMQGKWMKMTKADVAPGGGSTPHSHKDRPEVVYILKGTVVETQGAHKKTLKAGEGMQSNDLYKTELHQIQNLSNEEASVLVIEIVSDE